MVGGMGRMDRLEFLAIHPAKSWVGSVGALVILEAFDALMELHRFIFTVPFVLWYESWESSDSFGRVSAEDAGKQELAHHRAKERKGRHPFRVAVHACILYEIQVSAHLRQVPFALLFISMFEQELNFVDRFIKRFELQVA